MKAKPRKIWWAISATIAVIVVAAVILFVQSEYDEPKPDTKDQSSEELTFTKENAEYLEAALNSKDKEEQAKALVPQMRKGKWSESKVLPDDSVLNIDRSTFQPEKDGTASVIATVKDGAKELGKFTLYLAPVKNQWLIYLTESKE